MKNDSYVVIWLKVYVDFLGNIWVNEIEKLYLLCFDKFEVKNFGKFYFKYFCFFCVVVYDDVFLYIDMTEEGDIFKVLIRDICKYCLYER